MAIDFGCIGILFTYLIEFTSSSTGPRIFYHNSCIQILTERFNWSSNYLLVVAIKVQLASVQWHVSTIPFQSLFSPSRNSLQTKICLSLRQPPDTRQYSIIYTMTIDKSLKHDLSTFATVPLKKANKGIKPHKCSQCEYMFSWRGDLRKRLALNIGEKSYKCNQCDFISS